MTKVTDSMQNFSPEFAEGETRISSLCFRNSILKKELYHFIVISPAHEPACVVRRGELTGTSKRYLLSLPAP